MKTDSVIASIQKIISCELLVLILFITQSTITDLADLGSMISLRRHKTFSVRFPPIPRLMWSYMVKKFLSISLDSV